MQNWLIGAISFILCAPRRVTMTITVGSEVRILIWDEDWRSELTGGDKTKRNPVNSVPAMDESGAAAGHARLWRCMKKERESHHDEVTELRQTLQQQTVGRCDDAHSGYDRPLTYDRNFRYRNTTDRCFSQNYNPSKNLNCAAKHLSQNTQNKIRIKILLFYLIYEQNNDNRLPCWAKGKSYFYLI